MADKRMETIQKLHDILFAKSSKAESLVTALSEEIEPEVLRLMHNNGGSVWKSELEQQLVDELFNALIIAYKKAIEEALSSMLRQQKLMFDHRLRLNILSDAEKPNER